MRRRIVLVILGLTLVIAGAGYLRAEEVNIVKNPGFENLEGWDVPQKAEIDTKIYKTGPVTGAADNNQSLRLSRLNPEGWESAGQQIDVDGSDFYRIQAWIKMQNAAQTHFKVQWLDKNGKTIITSFICDGIDGDKDWFKVSKSMEAPKEAASAYIQFLGGGSLDKKGPGISWFDAIEFVKFQIAWKNITQAEWLKITKAKYGKDMVAPSMKEKNLNTRITTLQRMENWIYPLFRRSMIRRESGK